MSQTLKFNPANWRVPYDHVVFKDPKQILVTYCLQFLLVLLLYPIPEESRGPPPKNYFRHFLGRLHRPQDFQFIVDGMTRMLHQPVSTTVVNALLFIDSSVAASNIFIPAWKSKIIEMVSGNDHAILGDHPV